MRRLAALSVAAFAVVASIETASAGLVVHIDKSSQRMSVSVNGATLHTWAVSTGAGSHGTPVGRFRPQWLARKWFSTRYYGSPMPHSIFFHKGYAIHGTNYISRLGGPASHGCVRLHPSNAATLYALVQREGTGNTRIVISGSNPYTRGAAPHHTKSRHAKPARARSLEDAPAPVDLMRKRWENTS